MAVASFTVACTDRRKQDDGTWADGDKAFVGVSAWREMAEACAESLVKGTRVIVTGRLRQRSYETREGEKRTVFEVTAEDVAPSLRSASAKVSRASRQSRSAEPADDPWAADRPPF